MVYAPAERADTLLLFLLCPYMNSVGDSIAGYAQQLYIVSCPLVLRIFDFWFIFDDRYSSEKTNPKLMKEYYGALILFGYASVTL